MLFDIIIVVSLRIGLHCKQSLPVLMHSNVSSGSLPHPVHSQNIPHAYIQTYANRRIYRQIDTSPNTHTFSHIDSHHTLNTTFERQNKDTLDRSFVVYFSTFPSRGRSEVGKVGKSSSSSSSTEQGVASDPDPPYMAAPV